MFCIYIYKYIPYICPIHVCVTSLKLCIRTAPMCVPAYYGKQEWHLWPASQALHDRGVVVL